MTRKTKSGFHIGQEVTIVRNWRSKKPDGRTGTIRNIYRSWGEIAVDVALPDGGCHKTWAKGGWIE